MQYIIDRTETSICKDSRIQKHFWFPLEKGAVCVVCKQHTDKSYDDRVENHEDDYKIVVPDFSLYNDGKTLQERIQEAWGF